MESFSHGTRELIGERKFRISRYWSIQRSRQARCRRRTQVTLVKDLLSASL